MVLSWCMYECFDNQKWIIQGHGQHWTNETQDEDKQSKYTNTKLSNMNPTVSELISTVLQI